MNTRIGLILIGAASLAAATLSGAAGSGRETRPVTGFYAVEVGGGIDLRLRQGESFVVEVESPEGTAAHVVTEVRGDTLRVHHDRSGWAFFRDWDPHRHTVHVTLPKLSALRASGGSNVSSERTVTGDRLELTASGGADLTLDVAVTSLDVRTSGGADLRVTGSARDTTLRSSGGSDLDASGLTAETARVSSSGGSDLWIGQTGTLIASASGGSDVAYSGEPRSLTVSKSGGGDVTPRPGRR